MNAAWSDGLPSWVGRAGGRGISSFLGEGGEGEEAIISVYEKEEKSPGVHQADVGSRKEQNCAQVQNIVGNGLFRIFERKVETYCIAFLYLVDGIVVFSASSATTMVVVVALLGRV